MMASDTKGHSPSFRRRKPSFLTLLLPLLSACATMPLERGGTLSSYQRLTPSNGVLTHAQVSIEKDLILAAKSIHIIPTSLSASLIDAKISEAQRKLIVNMVDRNLCVDLSDRFEIAPLSQPADLTVH